MELHPALKIQALRLNPARVLFEKSLAIAGRAQSDVQGTGHISTPLLSQSKTSLNACGDSFKKLSYTIGTMSGLLISRERFSRFLRTSNSIVQS
jgi:hypothetical protein